jgi:hypothetical protein
MQKTTDREKHDKICTCEVNSPPRAVTIKRAAGTAFLSRVDTNTVAVGGLTGPARELWAYQYATVMSSFLLIIGSNCNANCNSNFYQPEFSSTTDSDASTEECHCVQMRNDAIVSDSLFKI